ncbi:MAG: archaellin/type IV pilin N-terminal domain-containing protein [Candidatus Micrarchaeia archaeon]
MFDGSRMKTKRGAVGIGTLIIFIAMVLVAAIAAAVLINTSGILQQRSMMTGKESIAQVSTNIKVSSIIGFTDANFSNIENLSIFITMAPGAQPLNLKYLIVVVGNNNNQTTNQFSEELENNTFTPRIIRDPNNLFSTTNPVIDSSSLVELKITPANMSPIVLLPPRTTLHVELIPEHGSPVIIETKTPQTYATSIQHLYP